MIVDILHLGILIFGYSVELIRIERLFPTFLVYSGLPTGKYPKYVWYGKAAAPRCRQIGPIDQHVLDCHFPRVK
jgi:hypothetical protein